jgi:hypothetical protein
LAPLIEEVITAGDANYVITKLLTESFAYYPLKYDTLNNAIGILGSVSMEFYRRLAAPYEDRKCAENGDIPVFKSNRADQPTPVR